MAHLRCRDGCHGSGLRRTAAAPRRWSDCTAALSLHSPMPAPADSRRRLHPPVASPVAAGTPSVLVTLDWKLPSAWKLRSFLESVSPKARRKLSARFNARNCDRHLLHSPPGARSSCGALRARFSAHGEIMWTGSGSQPTRCPTGYTLSTHKGTLSAPEDTLSTNVSTCRVLSPA